MAVLYHNIIPHDGAYVLVMESSFTSEEAQTFPLDYVVFRFTPPWPPGSNLGLKGAALLRGIELQWEDILKPHYERGKLSADEARSCVNAVYDLLENAKMLKG